MVLKRKKKKIPTKQTSKQNVTVGQILGAISYYSSLKLYYFIPAKDWAQHAQFHFKVDFFPPA